jgi:hypothetical protein
MSDPGFVGPEKTAAAKKPISPARRMTSLIVLAGVIVFGCVEVIPKWGYTSAVGKLEARTAEENKDLMTMQEAEKLIGKDPDSSAVDFQQGGRTLARKTYTWNGLLWHYTLTAHYSKEKEPHLIEYKTDRAEIPQQPAPTPGAAPVTVKTRATKGGGGEGKKGAPGKGGGAPTGSPPSAKAADDSKTTPAAPSDKPAETKSEPSDKAAAPSKPAAPSDSAPKDSPPPASDKPDPSKPATDPPAPKPSS